MLPLRIHKLETPLKTEVFSVDVTTTFLLHDGLSVWTIINEGSG